MCPVVECDGSRVVAIGVSEMFGSGHLDEGFPVERQSVARAVEIRRQEFLDVRGCAREALARLGYPPVPVVPGPGGHPGRGRQHDALRGVLGRGRRAVGRHAAVGIDAEPAAPLPDVVLGLVTSEEERGHLLELSASDSSFPWDRLLFSAKESVYKVWLPLMGTWLGFEDVTVRLDADGGTLAARFLGQGLTVDGARLTQLSGPVGGRRRACRDHGHGSAAQDTVSATVCGRYSEQPPARGRRRYAPVQSRPVGAPAQRAAGTRGAHAIGPVGPDADTVDR